MAKKKPYVNPLRKQLEKFADDLLALAKKQQEFTASLEKHVNREANRG